MQVVKEKKAVNGNISSNKEKTSLLKRDTLRSQAKSQAKKILNALDEANQIHEGKKQGKSFDQFLNEL